MSNFLETLCSPKVGLFLFGPVLALAVLKGCAEMESRAKSRPRRQ